MATAVRTDIMAASVDVIFKAVTNPDQIVLWHPHFRAVRLLTPEPIGAGARLEVRSSRMGVFELEVVSFEINHRYAASGVARGARMLHEFTLMAVYGGTRVQQTATGEAGFGLFGLLMPLIVRKSVTANAAGLRAYLLNGE